LRRLKPATTFLSQASVKDKKKIGQRCTHQPPAVLFVGAQIKMVTRFACDCNGPPAARVEEALKGNRKEEPSCPHDSGGHPG